MNKYILVSILCGLLIGVSLVGCYRLGYNNAAKPSYQLGFNDGKQSGYDQGKTDGYNLGVTTGSETGFKDGNQTGYQQGYQTGYDNAIASIPKDGYTVYDPTYQEMLNFVHTDETNNNTYIEASYTCYDYASFVVNNAQKLQIRCGFVYILFNESAHSIVCFNTTDNGLIFVEPQDDHLTTLTVGQPYWDRSYYTEPTFNDTVVRYSIIW